MKELTAEQIIRRRPEVVADVRRTPWKKRGLGRVSERGRLVGWLGQGLNLHVEQDGVVEKSPDGVGEDQVPVG